MYQGKGKCACSGIAYGKVVHLLTSPHNTAAAPDHEVGSVEAELESLMQAHMQAHQELDALIAKANQELGAEQAEIFEIHNMLLDEPDIFDAIKDRISQGGIDAATAALEIGNNVANEFAAIDDTYMRARANDIKDVTALLARKSRHEQNLVLTEPCILVADDLQPSQTISLDRSLLQGIVLRFGTQNSHASILARTMNIPLIINANLPASLDDNTEGQAAAVDDPQVADLTGHFLGLNAADGKFYIDPDEQTVARHWGKSLLLIASAS